MPTNIASAALGADVFTRKLSNVIEETVGMPAVNWHIVRSLLKKDGQHATDLANSVGRVPTSFTPILDKMQNSGLVERRPDPKDRRAVFIHLTTKGLSYRRLMAGQETAISNLLKERLALTDTDLESLQAALYTIGSVALS